MCLSVHDQWVDAPSDIVNGRVTHNGQTPGSWIDFDFTHAGAIRKYMAVHFIVAAHFKTVGEFRKPGVPRLRSQFEPINPAVRARRAEETLVECHLFKRHFEDVSRKPA